MTHSRRRTHAYTHTKNTDVRLIHTRSACCLRPRGHALRPNCHHSRAPLLYQSDESESARSSACFVFRKIKQTVHKFIRNCADAKIHTHIFLQVRQMESGSAASSRLLASERDTRSGLVSALAVPPSHVCFSENSLIVIL